MGRANKKKVDSWGGRELKWWHCSGFGSSDDYRGILEGGGGSDSLLTSRRLSHSFHSALTAAASSAETLNETSQITVALHSDRKNTACFHTETGISKFRSPETYFTQYSRNTC